MTYHICRFKSVFARLQNLEIRDISFPDLEECLQEMKSEVLELCRHLLPKKWLRGDYKELVQLVILYLDGASQADEDPVKFLRPGAVHKARFMGKLLYAYKLVLLASKISADLPKGSVFCANQLPRLERFVKFVTFCYVPWWLTCSLACDAPVNDLMLLQRLTEYAMVDADSARTAHKALSNHLWYLTEELVPLSLFSDSVEDEVKDDIAQVLLVQPIDGKTARHGKGFGKPNLPMLKMDDTLDLVSFFGQNSWHFFKLLKINSSFLGQPASTWSGNNDYQKAKAIVANLSIVNDLAERGVKLASEFLSATRCESSFQNVLQVVENDRHALPNQRNIKIQPKNWFLSL